MVHMDSKLSQCIIENKKEIIIVAGPNGCGKSTLANQIGLTNFINPDDYERRLFGSIVDTNERQRCASLAAAKEMYNAIKEGKSFAFETTFAGGRIPTPLIMAKEQNYKVILHYIAVENNKICTQRVSKRVTDGGHYVPSDVIAGRYEKSLAALPKLFDFADRAVIYDNSKHLYPFLEKNEEQIVKTGKVPKWAKPLIMLCEDHPAYCKSQKDMV